MKKFPRVVWDPSRLLANAAFLDRLCHRQQDPVGWIPVTKVTCADPDIVDTLIRQGYQSFADSRIENLRRIKQISPDCQTTLLRLPGLHEVAEVVRYADISLVSEQDTIAALQREAQRYDHRHKIILMIELGDLREGVCTHQALEMGRFILEQDHIEWLGIGTNLTCYGGVIPTADIMLELTGLKARIENELGHALTIVSGGNSSLLPLLLEHRLPPGINQLRLGEALFFGRETAYGRHIAGMHEDIFRLEAEVIEVKEKPSLPRGPLGKNAFGETPVFRDRGIHTRAIIALGEQDVPVADLIPFDPDIAILGGSSDHLILDVTGCDIKVGDVLSFRLNYRALLYAMTSGYVGKHKLTEAETDACVS
ncbi:alanine/ornithine racemase family PLP-dependent enzyme [Oceanisphaera sp. KMM 10153]|uniref:alanine/ornithine racemase family PLP-dependent enzyme n=1 Tax=Oceanisphaera submarina TaxID=3390193 RepID=UPI00397497CF